MPTEDFGIPVLTTWLEISSELTGKELSSSAVDVDDRIGLVERKAGLVWSDLVSTCADTNVENTPVCVAGLLVVAPGEGEGNDVCCGFDDSEDVCVDCGIPREGKNEYKDDGVWEFKAVGTAYTELFLAGA